MKEEKSNLSENNDLNVFIHLGLTGRQAQVYLAIARFQSGQTAKLIAKTVPAASAEIYRAIIELEKLGLIQRYLTTPVTFKATDISETFSILLQRNAEKYSQIKIEAKEFIKKFKIQKDIIPSQENMQYCLTMGLKAESREFARDIKETQISRDIMTDWKLGLKWMNKHFEVIKQSLERGVKKRYLSNIPKNQKMPKIMQVLKKAGSFEVKSALTIPQAGIDIFDKKIVHIIMPNYNMNDIRVLRLVDYNIGELAQEYFDMKWQSATTPPWTDEDNKT
jgi:sugar-specific transcriptional regulator TrmB